MSRPLVALAALLFAASFAPTQPPQSEPDRNEVGQYIEVTVLNARTGEPVTGAAPEIGIKLGAEDRSKLSLPAVIPCTPKPGGLPGVFVSRKLPPGRYAVEVKGGGFRDGKIEDVRVVENRVARVEVRLEPMLCLRGRVVDADTGRPVAAIVVLWSSHKEALRHLIVDATTDRDGKFTLEDVRPGEGLVMVASDLHHWMRMVDVPAENPPLLTIEVKTLAGLKVRFTGDVLPEKQVKVVVRNLDRASRRSFWLRTAVVLENRVDENATVAERGEAIRRVLADAITAEALRPGRHRVEAIWDAKLLASAELTLIAGQVGFVEFGPGHAVTGVYDEYGGRVTLPTSATMDGGPAPEHTAHLGAIWDAKNKVCRYCAGDGLPFPAADVKARLWIHVRRRPDPETRYSGTPVVIGADPDLPFKHVQVLMTACTEVQAYKIHFAVQHAENGKPPVRGRLPVFLPIDDHPIDKIFVNLVRRDGKCTCFVNRSAVGVLPECAGKLRDRLAALHAGPDTMVQIEPGEGVRHQTVVNVVEACRLAKIERIAFSPVGE